MWLRSTTLLLGVTWCAVARGDTNTPHEVGTAVSVSTTAGTVKGVLSDSEHPR
jgi:hypothetical protein